MDNTAGLALRTLQSGMMAGISSPARPWFKLTLGDKDLAASREVKPWLHSVRDKMLGIFGSSNVYNSLHVLYGELGAFGTSAIMPLFDYQDVVRSYNLSLGSYKLGTNHRGVVDLIIREFPMTCKQLIGEFGLENVSSVVRHCYDSGSYNTEFTVIHFVMPNEFRQGMNLDSANKAYSSIYYEEGDKDDLPLSDLVTDDRATSILVREPILETNDGLRGFVNQVSGRAQLNDKTHSSTHVKGRKWSYFP